MKLFIVSLFLPQQKATHAGGRYVFEIIKNMSKYHEIYLATRLEESEVELLKTLSPYCKEIYPYTYPAADRRGYYYIARLIFNYIGFSIYADKLIKLNKFDIVQVEWVETALILGKCSVPVILDAHDVITKPAERFFKNSKGIMRFLSWFRYAITKMVELMVMKKFDMIITLSDFDKQYLMQMSPELHIETVPIPAGLDITDRIFDRQGNTILFLASYKHHRTNVDAALYFYREIFPLIRGKIPDAVFIIAGYGPPEELMSIPRKDSHVVVTGFVDDLDECYKKAAVFAAPILTGGGIIVKILDALAAGTPVVTTAYGNEGIGAVDGRDLIVADDPESFATAVVKLLTNQEFAEKLGLSGQAYVRKNYSLESVTNRLENAYRDVLESFVRKG